VTENAGPPGVEAQPGATGQPRVGTWLFGGWIAALVVALLANRTGQVLGLVVSGVVMALAARSGRVALSERLARVLRAGRGEAAAYRALAGAPALEAEAWWLVGLLGLANAAGTLAEMGPDVGRMTRLLDLLLGVGAGLVSWWLGAAVAWLIGVRLLGGEGSLAGVRRAMAYAQVPGFADLLVFLPGVDEPFDSLVPFGTMLWALGLSVVAVREALGFGTGRALLSVALPLLLVACGAFFVSLLAG
jgi:hypothetical protein